jgi:hypothetical protein
MKNTLITNGDVLHAGRLEQAADVRIEGSRIVEIGKGLAPGPDTQVVDATGLYVLPGLIDIHNHGLRDVWVDRDDIHKYSRYQAQNGVTACVATLAARPQQDLQRMRQILRETQDFALTPNLIGFRPEILYLAKAAGGDAGALVRPDPPLPRSSGRRQAGGSCYGMCRRRVRVPFLSSSGAASAASSRAWRTATPPSSRRAARWMPGSA